MSALSDFSYVTLLFSFLANLAKDLSILLLFLKNQLFVLLIFSVSFLFFIFLNT